MFKKLSNTQKNKWLFPLAAMGLLLCWFLAFDRTFEAIKLNKQLSGQAVLNNDLSFNPQYTGRKLDALDKILKSYQVNEGQWHNDLWLKASSVAASQDVDIEYTMTRPTVEQDSTKAGITQTLFCYGNYKQFVVLMDTLERMPKIGQLAAVQIRAVRADGAGDQADKCILKLDFSALNKDLDELK